MTLLINSVEELAEKLKVYIDSTGGSGSLFSHALDSALHTGGLNDNQAPQFLKIDGSRDLTGHLNVDQNITIDGVDISEHALNEDSHHKAFVGLEDNYGNISEAILHYIKLLGANGLYTEAGDDNKFFIKADNTLVRITREVNTDINSLSGGGDLSQNRDLSVKLKDTSLIKNLGLSVNASLGLTIDDGLKINPDYTLKFDNLDKIGVNIPALVGFGLVLDNGGKIGMGLPLTINVDSTNQTSFSSHSHAVDSSNNVKHNETAILSSYDGKLTFDDNVLISTLGISINENNINPNDYASLHITSKHRNKSALDLKSHSEQESPIMRVLDKNGDPLFYINNLGQLESADYVSGLTGWHIDQQLAEFNNIVARGELHTSVLVHNEIHANGGSMLVLESSVLEESIIT